MTTRTTKLALLGTASAAAAAFVMPGAASAQSTTCTLTAGSTTVYDCLNDTTGVSTITVTSGTFTGTNPLVISSATGDISVTGAAVSGGLIQNTGNVGGENGLTLTNSFAGGAITLDAAGQAISTTGVDVDALDFSSTGGPVTITVGDLTTEGDNSYGVIGSGGSTTIVTTGNISTLGGTSSVGADIESDGDLTFTSGTVDSAGGGLTLVSDNGAVTATSGAITSQYGGAYLQGTSIDFTGNGVTTADGDAVVAFASTGDITLRTGAVSAINGTGIEVGTTDGNVDIGACPTVSSTGSGNAGILGTTTTGNITVNCGAVTTDGDGSDGVTLASTDGNISATLTSVDTGTGIDSDGVVIATNGTVSGNVGTITTGGADSAGLLITGFDGLGGSGAVNIGYGSITTSGTGASNALDITSTGTVNLAANTGAVLTTSGDGVTAALITGAGVTGNLGAITTTGEGSTGAIITSTGAVNLTTGAINTTDNGIIINADANNVTLTTGAVTTTGIDNDGVTINSTGTVNFTGGALTTDGDGSNGLLINGGTGAITATVAGGSSTGIDAEVVNIISAGGPVTFTNSGTITTAGSRGVAITGATTATVACGNISTTLDDAIACDIGSAGNTTVTGGTITTTGAGADGINVVNTAGTTTVTGGTTTVSGDGSIGIDVATSGTGAVVVNTGVVTSTAANTAADPSFAAVRAVAADVAPVTVNATGNITSTNGSGIWAQSGGTSTVVVNSGVTVAAPTAITLGGATGNTLTVNGTISSTGPAGTAAYTVVGGGPFTLNIGANGVLGGPLAFTEGNDTFTNASVYTQTSTIDFLGGNDTFNNSGTFNHGGIVQFGAGADTLNNSGTLNLSSAAAFDFGADADVFTNTGSVRLFNGAQTLAGLETFNNTGGLIDLRDGAGNDTLTIPGNYAATGTARLGIDVVGTTGLNVADRLVIGGTTTGTTTVLPTFITPVIDPTGALIVDSTLNNLLGTNFVLGGTTNQGFINYGLETRGGDVFLVSRPDEAVFDQLFVGRVANDIWYQSAEAYQAYAMSRRIDYGNPRKGPVGIWGQLYGSTERFGNRNRSVSLFSTNLTTSNRFETDRKGAQAGLDFGVQNFVIGVTAGYEHAKGDSDFGTNIDAEGYNYGAYAQFGAQQGPYAGLLIKRDDYDIRLVNSSVGALAISPDGRSTGIDGEVGFRFGNPGGINFDLGAGLSYVRNRVEDYSFGNVDFDNDRFTSKRGRIQARASFAGTLAPFVDAKLFHEFSNNNELTISSGTLSSTVDDAKRGTWGRLEAGLGGGAGGGPLLSGWVDLGDVKGYGVRGGFRF